MKSLICITTCNRLLYLKYILPEYIEFCQQHSEFDFLITLDGKSEEIIAFLKELGIPFLYSEEREGVGLAKNRVLEQFPEYDYYFFIDDDVQLLNGAIFKGYINLAEKHHYAHMSCGEYKHFYGDFENPTIDGDPFIMTNWGSGVFNFFTKTGLQKVGGWHTLFAKYRRYGHTEHTYRFFHSGLNPRPYIVPEQFTQGYLRFRNPPSVTSNTSELINPKTGYNYAEEDLIKSKSSFFPVKTISKYQYIAGDVSKIKIQKEAQSPQGGFKAPFMSDDEKSAFIMEDYNLLLAIYDEYYKDNISIIQNKNHIYFSKTYKLGRVLRRLLPF